MVTVRKASVQFLLALFVFNTAVCTCAATVSENAKDAHAHHQSSEAGSRSDCHDGVCLGSCDQAVVTKPGSVTALATVVRLELEPVLLETVELAVVKTPISTKITGPPFYRYRLGTDTPITRKDRLLA